MESIVAASPSTVPSVVQAYRRSVFFAAMLALTSWMVSASISIALFGRAILTGVLVLRDLRNFAILVGFFSTLWTITAFLTLAVFQEQRFSLGENGFTLPHRPFVHVLRRKKVIRFADVESFHLENRSLGYYATLRLRDGHVVQLKERDGVPGAAFETLQRALGGTATNRRVDS